MKKESISDLIKDSFEEYEISYEFGVDGADFKVENSLIYIYPIFTKKKVEEIKKAKKKYNIIFIVDKKNVDLHDLASELYTFSHLSCLINKFKK